MDEPDGTAERQPAPDAERSLESWIGAQVRGLRTALGMTLSDLAKAASISPGMLSKIEKGQTSPSLGTLQGLATALNIPLATFFEKFDEKREASFVRAGEGLTIERRGSRSGHLYQLLGASLRSKVRMEPYLITLDEHSDAHPIFRHPGVEFIHMLEGEVVYRHGEQRYHLRPGDSLFFDAEAAHGPLELRRLPCRYLSIIATAE